MKNPNAWRANEREEDKRPTVKIVAERIGVSQRALYKWFFCNAKPRPYNIQVLAKYLNCSIETVESMLIRSNAIVKAGYKPQYGQMIEPNMLIESYERLKNGENPFPEDNSIFDRGRIYYN